ncbi:hypothetical protein RUND412_003401 [Rhizina undulata]
MSSTWADYPFPLISTPAAHSGYTDRFIRSASKMALTHNIIIRGMNSIYLQSPFVTPATAASFIMYCKCWSEFIHNHHECEEYAYFPLIEKMTGTEGLSDTNIDQHEAFMGGLKKFDKYLASVTASTFSGQTVIEILDTFAATMQIHLTDEVVWILSLAKYPDLDLAAIDVRHGGYVKAHSSKTRLLPFFLSNHDLTYEDGIHRWWPTNSPLRDFFLRYVCSWVHRGAWEFSSCTLGGRPKQLKGVRYCRLGEVLDSGNTVEMGPTRPEKAVIRPPSKESKTN